MTLSCQLRIGKILDVKYIVVGDITKIDSRIIINLKILTIENSETAAVETQIFNNIDDVLSHLGELVNKIDSRLFLHKKSRSKITFSENLNTDYINSIEKQEKQELLSGIWQLIIEISDDKQSEKQEIKKILEDFMSDYPDFNPYKNKAKERLRFLKKDYKKYRRFYSPHRRGLSAIEWASAGVFFSNYGIGGRVDLLTLNTRYFFWDIIKFSGGGLPLGLMESAILKWSSLIGVPLWLNERSQFRLSCGLSWGLMDYYNVSSHNSISHTPGESESTQFSSFLNGAVEASFLIHMAKNAAFQLGISLDLPIIFTLDTSYRPMIGGFTGFRL